MALLNALICIINRFLWILNYSSIGEYSYAHNEYIQATGLWETIAWYPTKHPKHRRSYNTANRSVHY